MDSWPPANEGRIRFTEVIPSFGSTVLCNERGKHKGTYSSFFSVIRMVNSFVVSMIHQ